MSTSDRRHASDGNQDLLIRPLIALSKKGQHHRPASKEGNTCSCTCPLFPFQSLNNILHKCIWSRQSGHSQRYVCSRPRLGYGVGRCVVSSSRTRGTLLRATCNQRHAKDYWNSDPTSSSLHRHMHMPPASNWPQLVLSASSSAHLSDSPISIHNKVQGRGSRTSVSS